MAKKKSKTKEESGKKKYARVFACGKKVKLEAPRVWDRGWRDILDLARETPDGEPLPLRYVCGKCGRKSPVKSYLCKARPLAED